MAEWRVAPDGGRPEGRSCAHLETAAPRGALSVPGGCAQCVARGRRWVHLRECLTCGHIGCCDSSPGQHAWAHAREAGHPVAASFEKGEHWAWCYVDEVFLLPLT
ncbi:UBP-type zinc finger domain-containing protein [Streptomyces sp. C10-9-1]|uniref:UBP-type zinc finger domain-containing protein n=1 Tax=Streptomyces sp. C10-9-1 TaxID=1859285 RepID=UPI0035AC0FBA